MANNSENKAVINILETKVKEKISLSFDELIKEVNYCLNRIMNVVIQNGEHLQDFIDNETIQIRINSASIDNNNNIGESNKACEQKSSKQLDCNQNDSIQSDSPGKKSIKTETKTEGVEYLKEVLSSFKSTSFYDISDSPQHITVHQFSNDNENLCYNPPSSISTQNPQELSIDFPGENNSGGSICNIVPNVKIENDISLNPYPVPVDQIQTFSGTRDSIETSDDVLEPKIEPNDGYFPNFDHQNPFLNDNQFVGQHNGNVMNNFYDASIQDNNLVTNNINIAQQEQILNVQGDSSYPVLVDQICNSSINVNMSVTNNINQVNQEQLSNVGSDNSYPVISNISNSYSEQYTGTVLNQETHSNSKSTENIVNVKQEPENYATQNSKNSNNNENSKLFSCTYVQCTYSSTFKHNLARHELIVHKKIKEFKCKICKYETALKYHMTTHERTVHHMNIDKQKRGSKPTASS